MATTFIQYSPSFHFLLLLLLIFYLPSSRSQNTTASSDPSFYYNLCSPSTCGNQSLAYPFSVATLCNSPAFTTSCPGDGYVHFSAPRQTGTFRAFGNLTSDATGLTFRVAADSLFGCGPISSPNYSYQAFFSLPNNYTFGTHLNCSKPPSSLEGLQPASCLRCANGTDQSNVCYYSPGLVSNLPECEKFFIYPPSSPGFNISAVKDLRGFLQRGFLLRYSKAAECQSCEGSGGRCGASPQGSFVCFCKESVHQTNCSDGVFLDLKAWFPNKNGSGSSTRVLVIALSTSVAVLGLLALTVLVMIFAFRRKRRSLQDGESFAYDKAIAQEGLKDLVDSIAPKRYSYSQIKKFTNNFSLKLGEGGFGNIYKGVIHKKKRGLLIAVKVLKLSKQSEKQFMNEVATIGRIHHNNLVKMLGYCAEKKQRALVYEYMENGSLDTYIKMTRNRETDDEVQEGGSNFEYRLEPKQMHTIALETAMGILYLHEGCRSRILHCDIKPHNVLLDSNLSAKVSDFGLARMIDKDHSHISLTVAQGTPGYAAPEMWLRSYGPITDKSDVYSYGILLLEMAGGRIKNKSDAEAKSDVVAANSQVHLPSLVLKQVKEEKLVTSGGLGISSDQIIGDQMNEESDEEIITRMCLVGLWCIQHIPSVRPSMSRVIQMLKGSVEIEIPPDPFPHDEGNEQPNYLTTSTVYLSVMAETQ